MADEQENPVESEQPDGENTPDTPAPAPKTEEVDYKKYYEENEHRKKVDALIKKDGHGRYHEAVHSALKHSENLEADYTKLMEGMRRYDADHKTENRRASIKRANYQLTDEERLDALEKEALNV